MGVLHSIREAFAGRQLDPVTELLIKQTDLAIEAVELANQACAPKQDPRELKAPVKTLRAETKEVGEEVVSEMSEALTVPLEREDLSRAAQGLTAVTEDARDIVREMVLWDVQPGSWSEDALLPAVASLQALREALEENKYESMAEPCRRAYSHATKIRAIHRKALTNLFEEELSMETLKRREVLHRVDMVGRHLADLSATLLDALAKRFL